MRFSGQLGEYTEDSGFPHAEGGQAWVYRVQAPGGRIVAIKLAKSSGREGAWLDREREELLRLREEHPDLRPFLVEVLDQGTFRKPPRGEPHPFVVLEWFEQTLEQAVLEVPLAGRLELLARAAEALTRLHASERGPDRAIVHQDIKPSNFLVSGERVVLADFGGVKRAGQPSLSQHSLLGTVGFAPPDQLLKLQAVDRTWDVYALAVTAFWCLTVRLDEASNAFIGQVPATNRLLTPPLTREGQRLYQLRLSQDSHSAEAEALRAKDLGQLVRLDEMAALTSEDQATLQAALTAHLAGRVGDPAALASELVAELVPELLEALEPDRDRRGGTARRLQGTFRVLAGRVQRAETNRARPALVPPAGASVVAVPPPALPEPPPPLPQPRRRSSLPIWVALGVLGLAVGLPLLGLGGMAAFREAPEPTPPPVEVAESAIEVPLILGESEVPLPPPATAAPAPAPKRRAQPPVQVQPEGEGIVLGTVQFTGASGSMVSVNGREEGVSPFTMTLRPGSYRITVDRGGGMVSSLYRDVAFVDADTPVVIKLD